MKKKRPKSKKSEKLLEKINWKNNFSYKNLLVLVSDEIHKQLSKVEIIYRAATNAANFGSKVVEPKTKLLS